MTHSAVVLAAGRSTRMGRDKAMIEMDGEPLLTRQIKLARATGATQVFVSARPATNYNIPDCPLLYDRYPDAGPLAGIERALALMATARLLVLAVDLPAMSGALLQRIGNAGPAHAGAIPRLLGRVEPLAAFYPKTAASLAESLLAAGENSVTSFAERCVRAGEACFVDLDATDAVFLTNWNTLEDMVETGSGAGCGVGQATVRRT